MSVTCKLIFTIASCIIALGVNAQLDAPPKYVYQRGVPLDRQVQAWSAIDGLYRLDLRGAAVDADLISKHIKPIKSLRELRLSNLNKDSYAALGQVTQLRSLEFGTLTQVQADLLFAGIANLPLAELRIDRCLIKDWSAASKLRLAKTLQRLELPQYRGTIDDDALKQIAMFTELRHLNLDGQSKVAKGVVHFTTLTKLESFSLYGVPFIDDKSLAKFFSHTPNLTHIDLAFCWGHRGEGLVFPASLTHLNLIESKQLTDAAFADFHCLDNLIELNLYLCLALTDKTIQNLEGAKRIERLNVGCIRTLTNESLRIIGGLHTLTHLNIGDNDRFDDEGLAHIKELTNLQSLDLWHLREVTGSGLVHLDKMRALFELNLSDCKNLEDRGVIAIAKCPGLQYLYLDNCVKLTDHAIASLAGHQQLKYMSLSGCERLSDDSLNYLATIQSLKHLDISACSQMSDEAIVRMKKALPNCRVIY